MILYFKVSNFKAFKEVACMNFEADMRIKKFACNTISYDRKAIKKVSGIHGPNNTGKTCMLEAMIALKSLMLNEPLDLISNVFCLDHESKFLVRYIQGGDIYEYQVIYDSKLKQYIYEKLSRLVVNDKNPSIYSSSLIFEKSGGKVKISNLRSNQKSIKISNNVPLMMALDFSENESLRKAYLDYISFANSICLVRLGDNINLANTIKIFKNDPKGREFIKEFVKNCDLNIQDVGFDENPILIDDLNEKFAKTLSTSNYNGENLKIWTLHQGKKVPSVLIDSIGTQKIMFLASYIYEAIKYGKLLLIDEIDSSLHHFLSRSIISLFNNGLNNKGQLIFTSHDALLLDIKTLLRTDQIWLTNIDENKNSATINCLHDVYPASAANGIRGYEDVTSFYLKGRFGSIPTVDLFDALEIAIGENDGEKDEKDTNLS